MSSVIDSVAYQNGAWCKASEISWSVTDYATTQGALLVERLRTFGGQLFDVPAYIKRLEQGARQLGIAWPIINDAGDVLELDVICRQIVESNRDFVRDSIDVGIVLLLSPGDPGFEHGKSSTRLVPTLKVHLTTIPFSKLHRWYKNGVSLRIAKTRNVPNECWSPSIKTRSRLQYYLADREARESSPNSQKLDSVSSEQIVSASLDCLSVLLSTDGYITETSVSNVLLLGKDGKLRSPRLGNILEGVSLRKAIQIADTLGISVEYCDLTSQDLEAAQEVWLTGTTGCIWSAVAVGEVIIGNGRPGAICQAIQQKWSEEIGWDFVAMRSTNHDASVEQ